MNVSWWTPDFPGGPLSFYRLKIEDVRSGTGCFWCRHLWYRKAFFQLEDQGLEVSKDLLATDLGQFSYLSGPLYHGKSYKVTVVAVNGEEQEGKITIKYSVSQKEVHLYKR